MPLLGYDFRKEQSIDDDYIRRLTICDLEFSTEYLGANSLFDLMCHSSLNDFIEGKEIEIRKNLVLCIRKLKIDYRLCSLKIFISYYNPLAQLSTTPVEDSSDLTDVKRLDTAHLFLAIRNNDIYAGMSILDNRSLNKYLRKFFNCFIYVDFETYPLINKVNRDLVLQLQKEKFKAFGIVGDYSITDEIIKNNRRFMSFFKDGNKENPTYFGDLILDKDNNTHVARMVKENEVEETIPYLDENYYILTQKGTKLYPRDFKVVEDYYCRPYGDESIEPYSAFSVLRNHMVIQK